jgi:hypothetical protein
MNYFHNEKITAYYEKSHTIEKKSQMSQNEPKMPIPGLKGIKKKVSKHTSVINSRIVLLSHA